MSKKDRRQAKRDRTQLIFDLVLELYDRCDGPMPPEVTARAMKAIRGKRLANGKRVP